jgi:hypothetical protein
MPPLLPTPMLVAAGVVAFALAPPSRGAPDEQPPARRRSVRHRRLTCFGFAAAWAPCWWIEQRW